MNDNGEASRWTTVWNDGHDGGDYDIGWSNAHLVNTERIVKVNSETAKGKRGGLNRA